MRSFIHLHPHRKLQIIVAFFLVSWIIGSFLIHWFESAQHWSYFDSLYFTVMITATIGSGHFEAMSTAGRILSMIYGTIYVPLFLYSMTLLFEGELKHIHKEERMFDRMLHDTEQDVERIIEDRKPHN